MLHKKKNRKILCEIREECGTEAEKIRYKTTEKILGKKVWIFCPLSCCAMNVDYMYIHIAHLNEINTHCIFSLSLLHYAPFHIDNL